MAEHSADIDAGCGGCRGEGAHRRYCPRHPDYHPWRRLADMAETIGDTIGGSDTGLANQGYALAGAIRRAMPQGTGDNTRHDEPVEPDDPMAQDESYWRGFEDGYAKAVARKAATDADHSRCFTTPGVHAPGCRLYKEES